MVDGELGARIDPGSLRKLVQASRTWDKVSRAEMRKGLRATAAQGAEAAKREVLGPPPPRLSSARLRVRNRSTFANSNFGFRHKSMRSNLAKGVKVSISTGRVGKDGTVTGEGVRVTASGSNLNQSDQAMVKAYMAKQFRHPVFGSQRYATQRGKNWFFDPLFKGRADYQAAIVKAIESASEAIEKS